ncbi:MAG TPA: sensor histidine kinase [Bryobacteraceae bacterium]|nr:sensor histidine kinase [Bryobacteraceae bacterium]
MILGDALALWQFQTDRRNGQNLLLVDQKQIAVLRVHADLLGFREPLEQLLHARNASRFAASAAGLHQTLLSDIDRAGAALQASISSVPPDPKLPVLLKTIEAALPAQIDLLVKLTAAGDWEPAQLRLANQVNALASISSLAVQTVDDEVTRELARALASTQRAQRNFLWLLGLTGLSTALAAGILGFLVVTSITRPLQQLEAGARALARSEFGFQIPVAGKDELATVAGAFNYTAEKLNDLYQHLINAQEEERARIGRELHDDFGQRIAALSLSISALKRQISAGEPDAHNQADRLQQNLAHLGEGLRQLFHRLHPPLLEHCDLVMALRALCSEFSTLSGVPVSFSSSPDEAFSDVSEDAGLCLYRVAQEALQNVSKHAGMAQAGLRLQRADNLVRLVISDTGVGFNCERAGNSSGLGLVSMKERVRLLNGTFYIDSPAGEGTTVVAQIPVNGGLN